MGEGETAASYSDELRGGRGRGSSGTVTERMNTTFYVRFEVLTAVNMKNVVFCEIRTQFVLHRRHITSPMQSPAGKCYVRCEVFTAVTMNNVVFRDVTPCGSCKNRRFGGT
jgi:hypothetical protein